MICPKCGSKIMNECCSRCGYMCNGNNIKLDTFSDKYKEEKLYNSSFEEMMKNGKSFLAFLMGPTYFSYRNHLFFGIILTLIDIFISYFLLVKYDDFLMPFIGPLFLILQQFIYVFIIIKRILYAAFANIICLKIDRLEIKIIKARVTNYTDVIAKHEDRNLYKFLLNIIFITILISLAILHK